MRFRLICGLLVLSSYAAPAAGQFPSPALDFIYPAGGQAGTTVNVQIGGRDLDESMELVFSHPGIVGRAVRRVMSEFESEPQPVPGEFEVEIPLNVPAGIYDVRAVGRFGVSTPLSFVVGNVTEQLEPADHQTPDTAAELRLDVVVNGRADAGSVDYYRFSATEGQKLVVECIAQQIDTQLSPVLTILNDRQQQLARSARLLDPIIDFQVPATGTYLLAVHDHTYAGGNTHHYRLRIHTGPYLVAVSPVAAAAGKTQTFTVIGRNLPHGEPVPDLALGGTALERQSVALYVPPEHKSPLIVDPVAAPADNFAILWPTVQGGSNQLIVAAAQHPVVQEAEPNNRPDEAQKISIPCDLSGRFYPRRDQDWVEFEAEQGQRFQVRVISNRLGKPTDPELIVQKVTRSADGGEQASQVATEDDFRSDRDRYRQTVRRALELTHHDPVVRFTADETATYRVGLRDLNGSSLADPRFAYRMVIEPQRPDFQLIAWSQRQAADDDKKIDRQGMVLLRGGTLPVMIDLLRQGEFDGPVRVVAEQLPEGVTASDCRLGPGQDEAILMLSAAADAPSWCGPIRIVGEAEIDGQRVRRVAAEAILTGATENVEQRRPSARLARQMMLAVAGAAAPAQLVLGSAEASAAPVWETCPGAKLDIPLRLARHAELKSELVLAAVGLPEKVKVSELRLAPDTTDAQLQLTLDAADIPAGNYSVFLRGTSKASVDRNPDGLARVRARRAALNDVIAHLDAQVQQTAGRLAEAQQDVARWATLVSRYESAPETLQQAIQTATAQVDQLRSQLAALEASATSTAPVAASQGASPGVSRVSAALEKLAQEITDATASVAAQLQNADAAAGRIADEVAAARRELEAAQHAVEAAEAAQREATQRRQRADEFVKQLDQQVAEAEKNFGAVELAGYVHSPAFNLIIHRTPLAVQLPAEPLELQPGKTQEVRVAIQRRFGFADSVELSLQPPEGVTGLSADPCRIESDQTESVMTLKAGSDVPPGELTLQITLKLKFNDVELQDSVPLKVVVTKP